MEKIDVLTDMFEALVELLEKKGIITDEELDGFIKSRLERSKRLTNFEDVPD
jgi:hypothetical protein